MIIEHGLGGSSLEWVVAERLIALFARVYVYERAGYYPSDPPTADPTPASIATDLRSLLEATEIRPPYVLVGHSYGGVLVRQCALDWPRGWVQGLVIVDSAAVRNRVYDGWTEMLGPDGKYETVVGLEAERVLSDDEWATAQDRDKQNEGIAAREMQSALSQAAVLRSRLQNLEGEGRAEPLLGDAKVSSICCQESVDFRKVYDWGVERGYGSEAVREGFLASIKAMAEGDERMMREHLELSRRGRFVLAKGRQRTHNVIMVDPVFVVKEVEWVISEVRDY